MRTLKLMIAYDGTRYAGWQIQRSRCATYGTSARKSVGQATVQGALERAFERIVQEAVPVVGSGRTDTGVHALAQVCHLRTRSTMSCGRLLRAVNHLLPPDIAVMRIEEAAPTFHARFDVRSKRYRYRLFLGPVVPPFIRPYVHQVRAHLNVPLMRREAASLVGERDFRAFARRRPDAKTRRRVSEVKFERHGEELLFDIVGGGFLHRMVRSIVGTLIDIGRGRLPPGTIRRILVRGDRRLAGTTAPAHGLVLVSVDYHCHEN